MAKRRLLLVGTKDEAEDPSFVLYIGWEVGIVAYVGRL
jgi:hypothetical protein